MKYLDLCRVMSDLNEVGGGCHLMLEVKRECISVITVAEDGTWVRASVLWHILDNKNNKSRHA